MVITISASSYEALHFCCKQKFLKHILVLVSYYCLGHIYMVFVGCWMCVWLYPWYTPRYKSGYVLTLLRALVKKTRWVSFWFLIDVQLHISGWVIRISAIDQKEATRLD